MATLRDEYLDALGLDGSNSNKSKRKKALARAYELRTFEIEHYWKRAGYFWGFQVAIFAAFGLIWRKDVFDGSNKLSYVILALSLLGTVTSYATFLSALGSQFWQRNWELHIDMLEDEFEGRLYKTVWIPRRISYSVSKINNALCVAFLIFWCFVVLFTLDTLFCMAWSLWWLPLCVVVVILISLTTLLNSDLQEPQKPAVRFIRRPAPDEKPPAA